MCSAKGSATSPRPTIPGCTDAIAVEPPARVTFEGELAPLPLCLAGPMGPEALTAWYRVSIPAMRSLAVVLPQLSRRWPSTHMPRATTAPPASCSI